MNFEKRVYKTPNLVAEKDCIIVAVPLSAISCGGDTLNHFQPNDKIADTDGCKMSPRALLSALLTFFTVANRPSLAIYEPDLLEEDNPKKKAEPKDDPFFYFLTTAGKREQSVKVFCEYVYDIADPEAPGRTMLGWRFWFVSINPKFKMDKGLESLFAKPLPKKFKNRSGEKRAPEKTSVKIVPPLQVVNSRTSWTNGHMRLIFKKAFITGSAKLMDGVALPLSDFDNPAASHKIFSFKHSCSVFDKGAMKAASEYLNPDNYFNTPKPPDSPVKSGESDEGDSEDEDSDDEYQGYQAPQGKVSQGKASQGNVLQGKVQKPRKRSDSGSEDGSDNGMLDLEAEDSHSQHSHDSQRSRHSQQSHDSDLFHIDEDGMEEFHSSDDFLHVPPVKASTPEPAEYAKYVVFPMGAYPYTPDAMVCNIAFNTPITEEPVRLNSMTTLERIDAQRVATENATPGALDPRAAFFSAQKYFAQIMATTNPFTRRAVRLSPPVLSKFQNFLVNDNRNPGGMTCNAWIIDEMQKTTASGRVFCVIPDKIARLLDNALSNFGNMVAQDFMDIEWFAATAVCHDNVYLCLVILVVQGNVRKRGPRFVLVMSGPPAGGKSHGLDILMGMGIPGTVMLQGNQSEKANNTDECSNGIMFIMDEMNDRTIGRGIDGTGDASQKELWSAGQTNNAQCHVSEDGTRERQETLTERMGSFAGCTNTAPHDIPGAIKNRMASRVVPVQHRDDMNPIMLNVMLQDPENQRRYDAMAYRIKLMQALASQLQSAMDHTLLPQVQTNGISSMAQDMFLYAREVLGVEVETRHVWRVLDLTIKMTMKFALHMVFTSGQVIPPKTAHRLEHIFLCEPFLISTPEILYFAFSMLGDALGEPTDMIIMKAVGELMEDVAEERGVGSQYAQLINKTNTVPDVNRYFIAVESSSDRIDVETLVAERIRSKVSHGGCFKVSMEMIRSLLRKLKSQTFNTTVFKEGTTTRTTEKHTVNVLSFKTGDTPGMSICVHYVAFHSKEGLSLVQDAIVSTFDKYTNPDFTYVTGESMRYESESFPFLLKVIKTSKYDLSKLETKFEVPVVRPRFAQDFIYGSSDQLKSVSMHSERNYNLQEKLEADWQEQVGEPEFCEFEEYGHDLVYPDSYMVGHRREVTRPKPAYQKPLEFKPAAKNPGRKMKRVKMAASTSSTASSPANSPRTEGLESRLAKLNTTTTSTGRSFSNAVKKGLAEYNDQPEDDDWMNGD